MKKLFLFLCLLVVGMNTSTALADTSYFTDCITLSSVTIETNGNKYNVLFYTNNAAPGYSNPWTVNNITFTNVITGTTNYSKGYAYYIYNNCTMATVSGNGGLPYRYELISGSVTFTYVSNGQYNITATGYDGADYYNWIGSNVPVTLPNTLMHPGQAMTVTLNANTANHGSGSNTNATVTLNAASLTGFTATSAATGYTLEGYYTAATGGTKVLNANGTYAATNVTNYITNNQWTRSTSTTTLYAHMTANTYSVTLDKGTNGTSNGSATATYNSGTLTSVNHAFKTGASLLGYYTDASSGTKVLNANGTLVANVSGYTDANGRWTRTSATTLYAQWGTATYAITLDKGDNGTTDGSATATYNSNTITSVTHATKSNWSLTGYYTAATDGTKVINADGTLVANVDGYTGAGGVWTRTSGATLYAQWTSICTITLNKGIFGTANGTATIALHSTTFTSLTHATFPGVQLDGYYVNPQEQTGSRTKIINADGTLVPNTGYVNENGEWNCIPNITLYAHWRRYLVSYDYNVSYPYNSVSNPVYYIYEPGETISLIDGDVPGFEFQGWYLEDTYQTKVTEIDRSWIPDNGYSMRLYAKLSDPIVYKLTYSVPEGVAAPSNPATNPATYTIADVPLTLGAPGTREHYTFTCWKTESNNLLLNNQITRNNIGNYNLIAGWEPDTYSLTIHCQNGMAVWISGTLVTDAADYQINLPYNTRTQIGFDLNETNRDYVFDGIEATLNGVSASLDEGGFWEWYSYSGSGNSFVSDRSGYVTLTGNIVITYKSTNLVDAIWYDYLPGMIDHCDPDPEFPDDRTKDICVMIPDYWHVENRLTTTWVADADEAINTINDLSAWTFGDGNITWGGWYTDAALTTPIGNPAIPAHTHFANYPHFYAKWNAPIQYRDKGGAAYSGSTDGLPVYDYWLGPDVALPAPATRTGYTFGGWYDNSECTGDPITVVPDDYSFHHSNTNLPVVYANWTAATYAVTLNRGTEGSTDGSATATYDSNTLTSLVNATKTGDWILKGYYTETSGGTKVINADGTLVANVEGYTGEGGIWTRTSGLMTLYAQWEEAPSGYTVTFSAGAHGRSVTATAAEVAITSGASVTAGSSVTLTATAKNFFRFKEWQNGSGTQVSTDNPYTIGSLAENVNLTAVFEHDNPVVLTDNHTAEDVWYEDYAELVDYLTANNIKVSVRYERTINANTWSVFSLPFGYPVRSTSSVLHDKVYNLGEVIYTMTGLTLNFWSQETATTANTPYLFYSSSPASNLVFENVTLEDIAGSSYNVPNADGIENAIANSSVVFHNTTVMSKLNEDKTEEQKKKTIYLNNNRLYYLSLNKDSWMRAFRGYFELVTDNLRYVQPRVRIAVEGQTVTEIESAETDNRDNGIRKYMENGVLVIEREGVKYDATGARIN